MKFNAEKIKDEIIYWIQDFFNKNGKNCKAVIGISGGTDSSVVASLCVEALGKDRVNGVLMPNGEQGDIAYAEMLVQHLQINSMVINIKESVTAILSEMAHKIRLFPSVQSSVNLPPRIRMATLYAISQSVNGRVANTCNLSEDWVGYSTRYGDSVGDFSPLSNLTKTEVKEIGHALGLPRMLVEKTPSDGLTGKSDEDNLGFTYEVLDRYIRTGEIDDPYIKGLIDAKHNKNLFKLQPMPCYTMIEPIK